MKLHPDPNIFHGTPQYDENNNLYWQTQDMKVMALEDMSHGELFDVQRSSLARKELALNTTQNIVQRNNLPPELDVDGIMKYLSFPEKNVFEVCMEDYRISQICIDTCYELMKTKVPDFGIEIPHESN